MMQKFIRLREFLLVLCAAGIVVFAAAAVTRAQDGGGDGDGGASDQDPKPKCPNEKADPHLVGPPSSTAPTTTCTNGDPCGYVTTWGYSHWTCVANDKTKCLDTNDAPQVQSQVYKCGSDPTHPPNGTMCVQGTVNTSSVMAGKKTENCPP